MTEIPEIKEGTPSSLDEAKAEYRELTAHLNNCPEHGWAHWLENKINDRLTHLRTVITDFVIESEVSND